MKLNTIIATSALAIAGIALVGCGSKSEEVLPIGVPSQFQGDWQVASLADGKTDPEARGCLPGTDNTGITITKKISQTSIDRITTEYVGDPECKGKNTLVVKAVNAVNVVSKGENVGVFKPYLQVYTVKVTGAATVAMLNERKVCDRTDWAEKEYTELDEQLKGCTDGNTERTQIYSKEDKETAKKLEWKIEKQGKGIAISTRDTSKKDSKFKETLYFVK